MDRITGFQSANTGSFPVPSTGFPIEKRCSKCKLTKEIKCFGKCKKSKHGYQSWCWSCKSEKLIIYYRNNPIKRGHRAPASKEQHRKYSLKKYYKNRLSQNISRRIRKSLGRHKNYLTWELIVGYTLIELRLRLESQFDERMNWDNYATYWTIDHIIPISAFKFESYSDDSFKKCWALTNLQPLEKIENIKKSNKC